MIRHVDMGSGVGFGRGHGKIILLGEHSVVYGRPAIALGLPRGCSAEARFAEVDTLAVEPWGVKIEAHREETEPDRELLRRAFAALRDGYGPTRQSMALKAQMDIPGRAGLGGSAALSVAIVRAIDACLEREPALDEVIEASLRWERVFHGNPSGIDSVMAARGGLALYKRGEPLTAFRAGKELCIVVADSGQHGNTVSTVESVARQRERDRVKTEQIFDAIAALVNNAKSALDDGDSERLGQLMDLNQTLLNTLLLSTSRLEAMCQIARNAGALGAKLTGGGGGGCMIAIARDAVVAQAVVSALAGAGFAAFVEVAR